MKTPTALSLIQTLGIISLIVLWSRGEPPRAHQDSAMSAVYTASPFQRDGAAESRLDDEQRLRLIIREELAHQLQGATSERAVLARAADRGHVRDEAVDRQRRGLVEQQIETYRSVGAITNLQMEELQAQIAQLDQASSREMMRTLVTAMNSGEIDGRF